MARRDSFPFLTSFVAFLAVCCVDAFACNDGYFTAPRPGGGLMGGGTGCQKCPDGYNHSDTNANNQNKCYKISSSGERIYYGSSNPDGSAPRQCDPGKYYEDRNDSCENCPANFPSSDAGSVGREKCYGTYNNRKIYYKEIQCDPGKYLPAKSDQCETCLSGYACPGEKHFPDPSVAQGLVLCASGQVNSAKTECINQTSCNAGWYYDSTSANCAICPTGFTNSNTGSVGREKCYGTYNNKKIYYKEIQCDPGKYLPAKSDQCETCLAGYACRGTKQFPSPSIAQGLVLCASGQVNSAKTECLTSGTTHCDSGQYYVQNTCKDCPNGFSASDTDATKKEQCYTVVDGTKLYYKSIKCDPGTYLKKSSGSCSACADGYVCYGGTYWTSTTQDQGLKTCSGGKIPNANQTGCTYEENYGTVVNCEPGEYLPAGLGRCRKCSDNKKYCPGGQLTSSTTDQGLIDCPYGATANSGHTSCNFTLNQNRLKFGPKGKSTPFTNQCWTLSNTYDYAKCVLKTTGPITSGGAIKDEKQQTEQVQNYAPDLK